MAASSVTTTSSVTTELDKKKRKPEDPATAVATLIEPIDQTVDKEPSKTSKSIHILCQSRDYIF